MGHQPTGQIYVPHASEQPRTAHVQARPDASSRLAYVRDSRSRADAIGMLHDIEMGIRTLRTPQETDTPRVSHRQGLLLGLAALYGLHADPRHISID